MFDDRTDVGVPVGEEPKQALEPIKIEVEEIEEEGAAKWLETYGDMVTLLLTFFVLLFAYSTIDKQKFREIVISLRGTLGVLPGGERIFDPGDLPSRNPKSGAPVSSYSLAHTIPNPSEEEEEDAKEEEDEAGALIFKTIEKGVVVEISGHVLFERGKAELKKPGGEKFLDELHSRVISYFTQNDITVVGHTDDTSMTKGGGYEDNWHLSSMRALRVVQYYTSRKGVPNERFTIAARADNELAAREDNNITEEDRKRARRVDIIFHTQ